MKILKRIFQYSIQIIVITLFCFLMYIGLNKLSNKLSDHPTLEDTIKEKPVYIIKLHSNDGTVIQQWESYGSGSTYDGNIVFIDKDTEHKVLISGTITMELKE